ncbi:MAG: GIY-YIG nuclease family protein, partial [bacterium]
MKKIKKTIKNLPQKPDVYPYTLKESNLSMKINKKNLILRDKFNTLPKGAGVYLFKDDSGQILYIGKAASLKNRISNRFELRAPATKAPDLQYFLLAGARSEIPHRKPRPPKMHFGLSGAGWRDKIADIDWIETDDEKQAFLLENDLIKKYQPRYNIQWRDDKSYFWVTFSDDEWPKIRIVHHTELLRHSDPPVGGEESPARLAEAKAKRANAGRHKVGDSSSRYAGLRMTTSFGPFTNGKELRKVLRALRKIFPYRTC